MKKIIITESQYKRLFTEQDWFTNSDAYKAVKKTVKDIGSSAINKLGGYVKSWVGNNKNDLMKMPLYQIMLLHFLALRKEVFTNADTPEVYIDEYRKIIVGLLSNDIVKISGNKFGFGYNDVTKLMSKGDKKENIHFGPAVKNFLKHPSKGFNYTIPIFSENLMNHIKLSTGWTNVEDRGDHFLVTDDYDFNVLEKHPEKYTLEALPNTIMSAFADIGMLNLSAGMEELLSYWHKAGYNGYKVELKIPK
jgi:hypothetical protein